jgi:hypothetical protein
MNANRLPTADGRKSCAGDSDHAAGRQKPFGRYCASCCFLITRTAKENICVNLRSSAVQFSSRLFVSIRDF